MGKPFVRLLAICLAVTLLAGCAAPLDVEAHSPEPAAINTTPALPETLQPSPTPQSTAVSEAPAPHTPAPTTPLPETAWPAAMEDDPELSIAPLSAPDGRKFRNVFGNAAAAIYAEFAAFVREDAAGEGEAGEDDTYSDFLWTYYSFIAKRFLPQGGTRACMESEGIIFSDCVLHRGGEEMMLGFAAPGKTPFSQREIKVYYDGYPEDVFLDTYPLEQDKNEQYGIYTVMLSRSRTGLPEESLVEIRLDDANFVFRTRWDSWAPTFPQTDEEAEEWLLEAQALREALPAGYACRSVGDTKTTVDGLTFALTELTVKGNILRVAGDFILEEGFDAALEQHSDLSDIRLVIRGKAHHVGVDLSVTRVLPTWFTFGEERVYSACWEMGMPYHANEILNEEIQLCFEMPTQRQDALEIGDWRPRSYAFALKFEPIY